MLPQSQSRIRLVLAMVAASLVAFTLVALHIRSSAAANTIVDLAPLNGPPYSGQMNGIPIILPAHWRASASLVSDPRDSTKILQIKMWVREGDDSPIITKSDMQDWIANRLKPYKFGADGHRWLPFTVTTEPMSKGKEDLQAEFVKETTDQGLENLKCADEQVGLLHCTARLKTKDFFLPDEFYFDSRGKKTLISCAEPQEVGVRFCHHYFVIPKLRAVGLFVYSSELEIEDWDKRQSELIRVIDTFTNMK